MGHAQAGGLVTAIFLLSFTPTSESNTLRERDLEISLRDIIHVAEDLISLNLNYYDAVEDPCSFRPCFNHGTCTNTESGYRCHCGPFFMGKNCEKAMVPCHIDTCGPGECLLSKYAPHYKCRCPYPHHGQTCSKVASVCTQNPCRNGGTCLVKPLNKFLCVCPKNYRGTFCDIPSHDCYRNNGLRYRGHVSLTAEGRSCLPWDSYHLIRESVSAFIPEIWAHGIGDHNFCRNPDGADKPWCYFLSENGTLRWDFCDVANCAKIASHPNITIAAKPAQSTASPRTTVKPSDAFSTCGLRELPHDSRRRILGGKRTQPGKHPWLASLQLKTNLPPYRAGHLCGGILIAECWILTAAHCVKFLTVPSLWKVLLGKVDLQMNETSEQVFDVEKIFFHERYREGTESLHNDVALMKLKKVNGKCARETQYVKAACLPEREFSPGKICVIAGWGMTETGYTSYMLDASVQVISAANCSDAKSYGKLIDNSMLCAGVPEGGTDSCQGDSGGPLACDHDGVAQVAGVVSWGEKCGVKNKPGVYANVYRFLSWIKGKMKLYP